jgi:hypothetical protein
MPVAGMAAATSAAAAAVVVLLAHVLELLVAVLQLE